MRRLPGVVGGQFAPVVEALVLVLAGADHGVRVVGLAGHAQKDRAGGGDGGGGEEFAAVHGRVAPVRWEWWVTNDECTRASDGQTHCNWSEVGGSVR